MSLAAAKPLDSWGSVDPGPVRYSWLTIDYPIHVGCLPGLWNMYVENARNGNLWMVPGTHYEEPAVEREIRNAGTLTYSPESAEQQVFRRAA